jgi:hypothetical protein
MGQLCSDERPASAMDRAATAQNLQSSLRGSSCFSMGPTDVTTAALLLQASAGLKPWPVHCAHPGDEGSCVPALAKAAAAAEAEGHPTRAVLLCHPNNPIVSRPVGSQKDKLSFCMQDVGVCLHPKLQCPVVNPKGVPVEAYTVWGPCAVCNLLSDNFGRQLLSPPAGARLHSQAAAGDAGVVRREGRAPHLG